MRSPRISTRARCSASAVPDCEVAAGEIVYRTKTEFASPVGKTQTFEMRTWDTAAGSSPAQCARNEVASTLKYDPGSSRANSNTASLVTAPPVGGPSPSETGRAEAG